MYSLGLRWNYHWAIRASHEKPQIAMIDDNGEKMSGNCLSKTFLLVFITFITSMLIGLFNVALQKQFC